MSNMLPMRMVERPWGRTKLPAPFVAPAGQRIGEVWFDPPAALDQLLVKYIFTSQALSVQVHPSDEQLPGHGKEECWLILDAEPGARIGIGFRDELDVAAIRGAALDGSIEQLLAWHPVAAGDFFYIPAGTVHAIGAGLSLIEVQQNSDTTYRLYDYGRDRPLHLDQGLAVARTGPHPAALRRHIAGPQGASLANGPPFRIDRIAASPDEATRRRYAGGPLLVIPLNGAVELGGQRIDQGNCALAADIADLAVKEGAYCLIAQPCTP